MANQNDSTDERPEYRPTLTRRINSALDAPVGDMSAVAEHARILDDGYHESLRNLLHPKQSSEER